MSGLKTIISGPQKPKESAAVIEARKRQEESLARQEAQAQRQTKEADKREEELSGNLAAQRRAISSKRKGRGGLAFSGPVTQLKTQLGA